MEGVMEHVADCIPSLQVRLVGGEELLCLNWI